VRRVNVVIIVIIVIIIIITVVVAIAITRGDGAYLHGCIGCVKSMPDQGYGLRRGEDANSRNIGDRCLGGSGLFAHGARL
jgi:hypothetical protein